MDDHQDKKVDANLTQINSIRDGELTLQKSHLETTRFGIFSCIAIQFATTAPPLAIALYSGLITAAGGSPYFFWGFIVAWIGQMFMAMSLAEISSSYPQTTGKTLVCLHVLCWERRLIACHSTNLLGCRDRP